MTESPRRDLDVFDFKEDDEIAEIQLKKFKSPSLDDQSGLKCEFLGFVSQVDKFSIKDVGSIPCIDIDAVDGDIKVEKGVSDPTLATLEEKFDKKEMDFESSAVQQLNSTSHENEPHINLDIHEFKGSVEPETKDTSGGVPSPGMSQIDPAQSGSPSSNELVDINMGADDCMNESTPSSPASENAEHVALNGYGLNDCTGSADMDDTNMEVVLYPDYIIYQDNYYTGPKLTFSHCCIKINDSTACGKEGAIHLEWAVDDLVDIKCQLFQTIGLVIIKLHVISSNTGHSEVSNYINGTAGIEELKIAVVDSNWSLRHKEITSLNVKYSAIWNIVLQVDVEGDESDLCGRRCYFPNFDEPFDEVVYPKGDPDAVCLSKRDVDLLQPDTFINDTIIDFYINYLKNQISEEEKHRFHFFNSFFFRKLVDMDKNPSSASDGRAAFLRVRKWTRKVNLFEKDYIFIPVNFNLHWSLLVICHPGAVVGFNDEDLDRILKVPCILHMDSIKGSHSGLKNLVQSYLWEEWKERQKDTFEEDLSSRFFNMRFLPLALPQQENSFDCGLFLLHYLELFLAEAPVNFNPFKVTKFSHFLNADWFPPAEAYFKRTLIQRLISELLESHSREVSSSDYSDDHHYLENNEDKTGNQVVAKSSPEINGESTTCHSSQGIEITLLSAASSLDPQSLHNSGLVLRELFEPGAAAGALVGQCQPFDHRSSDFRLNNLIFPTEEGTETGEQFMYLTTDTNFQQVAGITSQACEFPYLPRGCGAETCHKPEISLEAVHDKAESSMDATSSALDDSDDIGVIENCPIGNEAGSSEVAKQDERNCSSMENLACLTEEIMGSAASNMPIASVVESLQDTDTMCDSNKNGALQSSCEETPTIPLQQVSDAVDDRVTSDDVQMIDGMAADFCDSNKNGALQSSCQETKTIPLHQVSDAVDDKVTSDDVQMIDGMAPNCCDSNKNGALQSSCEETPTIPLQQVSDAVDDRVTSDDVQMIDGMAADFCDSNKNGALQSSCQETKTIPLHQVSDAVDDKVTSDDVQMIDGMASDYCEEQAAKRRRLLECDPDSVGIPIEE